MPIASVVSGKLKKKRNEQKFNEKNRSSYTYSFDS